MTRDLEADWAAFQSQNPAAGDLFATSYGAPLFVTMGQYGRVRLIDPLGKAHDPRKVSDEHGPLARSIPGVLASASPVDTDNKPRIGDLWTDRGGERYFVGEDGRGDLVVVCWGDVEQVKTWDAIQKNGPLTLLSRDPDEATATVDLALPADDVEAGTLRKVGESL